MWTKNWGNIQACYCFTKYVEACFFFVGNLDESRDLLCFVWNYTYTVWFELGTSFLGIMSFRYIGMILHLMITFRSYFFSKPPFTCGMKETVNNIGLQPGWIATTLFCKARIHYLTLDFFCISDSYFVVYNPFCQLVYLKSNRYQLISVNFLQQTIALNAFLQKKNKQTIAWKTLVRVVKHFSAQRIESKNILVQKTISDYNNILKFTYFSLKYNG